MKNRKKASKKASKSRQIKAMPTWLSWKIAVLVIVAVSLLGGYSVYRSYASSGYTQLYTLSGGRYVDNYAGVRAAACKVSASSGKYRIRVLITRPKSSVWGVKALRANVHYESNNGTSQWKQTLVAKSWWNDTIQLHETPPINGRFNPTIRFSNNALKGFDVSKGNGFNQLAGPWSIKSCQ